MIDTLALLAIGAFGWGLSLATYRVCAQQYGWPMGTIQWELPQVPVILGVCSLIVGLFFAAARGTLDGGIVIVLFGVMLALFWTGFMRVAAQTSLVLAPIAAALLLVGWLSGSSYPRYPTYGVGVELEVPSDGARDPRDRGYRRGE